MVDTESDPDTEEVTETLNALAAASGVELVDLQPVIYDRLRQIARGQKRGRAAGPTALNTTALVHEAYLKLSGSNSAWNDREHFFATCAKAMRQVLVDAARARLRAKRRHEKAPLDEEKIARESESQEVIALHEHLGGLHAMDERLARVVEYKFFLGMTEDEIAELMNVSRKTIQRDWIKARAWLHREMDPNHADTP